VRDGRIFLPFSADSRDVLAGESSAEMSRVMQSTPTSICSSVISDVTEQRDVISALRQSASCAAVCFRPAAYIHRPFEDSLAVPLHRPTCPVDATDHHRLQRQVVEDTRHGCLLAHAHHQLIGSADTASLWQQLHQQQQVIE